MVFSLVHFNKELLVHKSPKSPNSRLGPAIQPVDRLSPVLIALEGTSQNELLADFLLLLNRIRGVLPVGPCNYRCHLCPRPVAF